MQVKHPTMLGMIMVESSASLEHKSKSVGGCPLCQVVNLSFVSPSPLEMHVHHTKTRNMARYFLLKNSF